MTDLILLQSERVQDSRALHRTFNVDPLYLQHENTGLAVDYMVGIIPFRKNILNKEFARFDHCGIMLSKFPVFSTGRFLSRGDSAA